MSDETILLGCIFVRAHNDRHHVLAGRLPSIGHFPPLGHDLSMVAKQSDGRIEQIHVMGAFPQLGR